jgi:hypothetical protein
MYDNYLIKVVTAKYIGDYKIRVKFSTGEERIVDMETELWGEVFEPLKDKGIFEQLTVNKELCTIVWPNGADYAPYSLYDLGKPIEFIKASLPTG